MDPPYFNPSIERIIEQLANSKLVGDKSVVVVTHSPHRPLKPTYAALVLLKEHRHGDSVIALYRKEARP
jgi:16S rRNA G966 N2-methylase RsmD